MKKYTAILLFLLITGFAITGCGSQTTGTGEKYTSEISGNAGIIEYAGSILFIKGGEYITKKDGDYFCLHMSCKNNTGQPYALASLFSVFAVQGSKVLEARQADDYDTAAEANAWKDLRPGEEADCDYYFSVDKSRPVRIHVVNPDEMDTIMAEFDYFP